jgi:hypothetical protein
MAVRCNFLDNVIVILMQTIKDVYIEAMSEPRLSHSSLLFCACCEGPTGKNETAVDPHLPELLTLAVFAAFGCGLALAEGHFLFVGIFAATSAVMIIEAIRRSR